MKLRFIILICATFIFMICNNKVFSSTVTIPAIGDNFLKDGHNEENEGSKRYIRIQNENISHLVVRFSQSAIDAAALGKILVSASLQFYIESNYNNWHNGALINVHRLLSDWTEMGSTWSCPNDTNLSNSSPDCPVLWNGGTFDSIVSGSSLHENNQTGWKSFDVTDDVRAFLAGTDNFGWLIKKIMSWIVVP